MARLHTPITLWPMARRLGSPYPRELEFKVCEPSGARRMLKFDYGGYHRVVQPYCHGFISKRAESLRAVQVNADEPDYNRDDTAMSEIHCRVKSTLQPRGRLT